MRSERLKIAELEAEVRKLRHLLKAQMMTGESLEFEAIVRPDGEPLINLRWDNLAHQLPVGEARAMCLEMLRVCEWAEVDAATFAAMRKAGFDDAMIAGFMGLMREARGGSDERSAKGGA